MPFESLLNYSEFSIRVPEAHVERLDEILRGTPAAERAAMRARLAEIWTRFTYARAVTGAAQFLSRPELPRDFLHAPPVRALKRELRRGAPDAFDTIMLALASRLVRGPLRT